MKAKVNARQKRETEIRRRMKVFCPEPSSAVAQAADSQKRAPAFVPPCVPDVSPEEETRQFLEYLERFDGPVQKDEGLRASGKKGITFARLNLEEGMPLAEEALDRMNIGLQEMRVSGVRFVKLIHGYGSTGRGGKIRTAVLQELAAMKRKGYIRDYIPGEHFGPLDSVTRRMADQDKGITRDTDYGRMNHGITIVVL